MVVSDTAVVLPVGNCVVELIKVVVGTEEDSLILFVVDSIITVVISGVSVALFVVIVLETVVCCVAVGGGILDSVQPANLGNVHH